MKRNALSDVSPPAIETPHYVGHRERLRARFLDHGAAAIRRLRAARARPLCGASRAPTVKPLAKHLIADVGSFADVIAAPRERLKEFGLKDASIIQLKIIEAAALRLSRSQIMGKPAISSWAALIDYLLGRHGAQAGREEFRVLFSRSQERTDRGTRSSRREPSITRPVYPARDREAGTSR